MSLTVPVSLLAAHFIGDFICQTDSMALNKSKSWKALYEHVHVYSTVMGLAFWWTEGHILCAVYFTCFTFLTHFITDAITSRITSKLWFIDMEPVTAELWYAYNTKMHLRHWFFVAIGADQLIHYVTLALTLRLL